jgi:hypothetical protein
MQAAGVRIDAGIAIHAGESEEEQMATAMQQPGIVSGNYPYVSEEARRLADVARAERERKMQALNLQRENILSQKTSSPARRTALEAALVQIEGQIEALR